MFMWTVYTKSPEQFSSVASHTGQIEFVQQPSVEDVMLYYGYDPDSVIALHSGETELTLDFLLEDQTLLVFAPLNYQQILSEEDSESDCEA